MRIDLILSKLCLIKTRSIAKTATEKDLVCLNGHKVKASATVKSGDIVSFSLSGYKTIVKILSLPTGNVSKKNAPEYYEILERSKNETVDC
jgi:ribosomal 50S subunit-recycling heat shock protein